MLGGVTVNWHDMPGDAAIVIHDAMRALGDVERRLDSDDDEYDASELVQDLRFVEAALSNGRESLESD